MATTPDAAPTHRRRRLSRGLILGVLAGGLAVLLLVGYFLVTSSGFLKGVVLPRVGAAMNAKVTADEIALSPFSSLHLKRLQVETTGDRPLLRAEEVFVRYRLFSVIRGNPVVPEVRLVQPEVNVLMEADGRSNLDPLLASSPEPAPAGPGETPRLDIGKITVDGGSLLFRQRDTAGRTSTTTVTNLTLAVENLRNGGELKMTLQSALAHSQGAAGRPADELQGRFNLEVQAPLGPDLLPRDGRAKAALNIPQASGALRNLAGIDTVLDVHMTPTELRQALLRFQRQGQNLGEFSLAGPLDVNRREGRLTLQVSSVDRAALGLLGAPLGLDFGESSLTANGFILLANRGQQLTTKLTVTARQFSVARDALRTPPLDLQLEVGGNVGFEETQARLDTLQLTGRQAGRELVSMTLDRTMNFYWGRGIPPTANPAQMRLSVTNLSLADWPGLAGTNHLAGRVDLAGVVNSEQAGARINFAFTNTVQNLRFKAAGSGLQNAGARLEAHLVIQDYSAALIEHYLLRGEERGQELFSASGSASYGFKTDDANLQLTLDSELPRLLAAHPLAGVKLSAGKLRLNSLAKWSERQKAVSCTVLLSELRGQVAGCALKDYSATAAFEAELGKDALFVRRAGFTAREGSVSGGAVELSGKVDSSNQSADFALNVAQLNELALAPWAGLALPGRDLASVLINGQGRLQHAAPRPAGSQGRDVDNLADLQRYFAALQAGEGEARFSLQGDVSKLALRDHATQRLTPAVGFGTQLEVHQSGRQFTLTNALVRLDPTPLATNVLTLHGLIDLRPTNAVPSALVARADALDFTPLCNLFMGATTTNAPAARPATPTAEVEPPPVKLPLRQFTADLNVGRLHVRDVTVKDWTARARLEDNRLTLAPFALKLNDAPVSAEAAVDLNQPGYQYSLALQGAKVPLEPIVSSFVPSRAGQIHGVMDARAQARGAGVTGPSLQKNLAAQIDFGATNLNLKLDEVRSSMLKAVINVVVGIPDLIRNPGAAVGNLLGSLVPGRSQESRGWTDELAKAPLDSLALRGALAQGLFTLETATVQSPAFRAQATGTVTLAPVLTNSTLRFPLAVWLRGPLAQKIGFSPPATGDTNYAQLPDFVTLSGTVGAPKSQINPAGVATLTARLGTGLLKNTGNASLDKAADTVGLIGNLLGGGKESPPAKPATTNAPGTKATNAPRSGPLNLLDILPKKKD